MVAYVPPKQAGKYKAVASGAITNGKPVVVNTDGTIGPITSSNAVTVYNEGTTGPQGVATDGSGTVVIVYRDESNSNKGTAIVGTISGGEITFGSETVFTNNLISNSRDTVNVVYDSSTSKFVILYDDGDNSNYPTAIVATVSGTSISFGTAVVIDSNTSVSIVGVYDSTAQKIVIPFYGYSNALLHAVVGTVSGTGISFGSRTQLGSFRPDYLCAAYDSNANKTVVAFQDAADTQDGFALVCTVSGTSISAGSATNFTSANSIYIAIDFDSTANKVVIAFNTSNINSNAIVGTVSGTSISFGTASQFASYGGSPSVSYDSTNNKTIIVYDDSDANLKRIIGTVSGTSISYDTATTLLSGNQGLVKADYDSTNNTVIAIARNFGNSSYGTSVLVGSGTYSATSTNLTSENYIGIASGGTYADTAEATIDVVGTVNKDQSGLTAGQTYYVQTDGTLGTSADDPSVVAGTAISATELIVKG